MLSLIQILSSLSLSCLFSKYCVLFVIFLILVFFAEKYFLFQIAIPKGNILFCLQEQFVICFLQLDI